MPTDPKTLVERFYAEVSNHRDEKVAREILDPVLTFRASLGPSRRSVDGFIEYVRSIHAALGNYQCIIDDLIATEERAAARMSSPACTEAPSSASLPPAGKSPGRGAPSSPSQRAGSPTSGCSWMWTP
jgi:predicted ester cyclase